MCGGSVRCLRAPLLAPQQALLASVLSPPLIYAHGAALRDATNHQHQRYCDCLNSGESLKILLFQNGLF